MSGANLEPRKDTRPEHRPRSTLRVLALSLGMLVFLGLVAAVSRAHRTPGSSAGVHSPPRGVGDYVFTIFVLVILAMTGFMFWLWLANRDLLAQQRMKQQRGGMNRLLILLMGVALIAALLSRAHRFGIGSRDSSSQKIVPSQVQKALSKAQKRRGQPSGPQFEWLPVFVAGAAGLVVLGFIGIRSARRGRRGLAAEHALKVEFEELVDDTLADLYAEKDPRKAIIAAYARIERIFASYGLAREPSEAPVEYLRRVLPELRASGAALERLTKLFEWAKFSAHDVDRPMRDEAIGALVEVRDELRANRIEAEVAV